jgi:dipeptidyl aminopeptidase/acylaminoacyl peptidase
VPAPAALLALLLVAPESWRWTVDAIVDTVAVGDVVLSPDGQTVVFSRSRPRAEGVPPGPSWASLWRVPFAGGEPRRLTSADGEDSRPRFAPDGSRLAFLGKRGDGQPKARLWLLPLSGPGESEPLSDPRLDVKAFEWSPDGRTIALVAAEPKPAEREADEKAGRDWKLVDRDQRPRRVWLLDVATRAVRPLAALGDLSAWDIAWAPDSQALAATVTDVNRTDDSYLRKRILVLPLSGEARQLAGTVGKVGRLAWSHDGRSIAWLGGVDGSDPSPGSVFIAPAAGGPARNLTGDRPETCTDLAWGRDGRLGLVCLRGTHTSLERLDLATGRRSTVLAGGALDFQTASWSLDGSRYAVAGDTADDPRDVHAGAAPAAGKPPAALRRLVDSNPQLAGLPRGSQETLSYPARDGLALEAILVRPVGFQEGRRYPLVVVVHGGPEYANEDGWQTTPTEPTQLLAERGYLVLFPNYRGSTGRGVAFAKADHRDLGGKEFDDVLDAVDFLVAKGWADPAKVGITGGSYGGYFTGLGVTRHSDRFAAGVTLFGIASWESFLGQTDIPAENESVHWDLSCDRNPALCRDRSPVAHAERARTPTLILQGEKDERVPRAQSDELFAALRRRGVDVEYVVYPREEHGFQEREHRRDAARRLVAWFERHLAGR